MKEEFKLTLDNYGFYRYRGTSLLCAGELRKYFFLPPCKNIIAVLSDKPMKESYKFINRENRFYDIETYGSPHMDNVDRLIKRHFPKGCYARLEYEV